MVGSAERLSDRPRASRARLLAARALCQREEISRARRHIQRCTGAERPSSPLHADWLLATAGTGGLDSERQLDQALEGLGPERDHDRLAVLLELADRREGGGDPYRARQHLQSALALALQHDAHLQAGRAGLLLGSLLLRGGALAAAHDALELAWSHAGQAQDSLGRAAIGTILAAMAAERSDWPRVLEICDGLAAPARARRNPALKAQLALDRSVAWDALGQPEKAIGDLLLLGLELESEGEQLALNLLRARLGELRLSMGEERFGGAVQRALAGA